MENIIEFKNISKIFVKTKALSDVSFAIRKGEIHTIVGENGAGKSTLMKILSGMYTADSGSVIYKGESVVINDTIHALENGISTVYQELQLCENMRVVENLYMGKELKGKFGKLDWATMEEKSVKLLSQFKVEISPRSILKKLPVAQRQIVEIARAINQKIDVLILDEPTSSLTHAETEVFFEILRSLKEKGVTILFISHRLEEIFEITDRISILRDGKFLGTYDNDENIDPEKVVEMIAGKSLAKEYTEKHSHVDYEKEDVLLSVKDLCQDGMFKDVSFDLHRKEILGFYGLQGAGRTEVMEAVFGKTKIDSGEVFFEGRKLNKFSPSESIKIGMGLVPEDRRRDGIFAEMDIAENVGIIHSDKITTHGLISKVKQKVMTNEYVKKFSIKISGQDQLISKLSGGNQQKVIISRCLSQNPELIFFDEPTRGIDVGAKSEIYKIMKELQQEGKGMIMISSEIEEVVSECDRVIVMRKGGIAGELHNDDINKENILKLAFGS